MCMFMSMTPRTLLGATRAAVGLGAWFAPDLTCRAFGIDPERSDRFVARLFGARELALAGTLLAAPPAALAQVAAVGAAVDAIDVVSGLQEHRRGTLSTTGAVLGAGGAALFVALGVLAARAAATPDA